MSKIKPVASNYTNDVHLEQLVSYYYYRYALIKYLVIIDIYQKII